MKTDGNGDDRGSNALLGILLAAMFVVSCGGQTAAPSAASSATVAASATPRPPATKLTMSFSANQASMWPFFIAEAKGYYKDANVEVTNLQTSNGTQAIQGLISKSLDVAGNLSADFAIGAIAKGADLAVVANMWSRPVYSLIVRPGTKTYLELKGKRLGVFNLTSFDAIWLKQMLQKNGVNESDVQIVEAGGSSTRYQALKAGGLDGTLLTQPQDIQAIRDGSPSLGVTTDFTSEIGFGALTVSRAWATQNEAALVAFLSALQKSITWLYKPENRTEAIKLLVDQTKAVQQDAEQTYDLWIKNKALPTDGKMTVAALQSMVDILVQTKQLDAPVAIDKILDNSYADKALKR
jgi:NitT/TauT family transport system substrate-binding protein